MKNLLINFYLFFFYIIKPLRVCDWEASVVEVPELLYSLNTRLSEVNRSRHLM